MCASSSINGIVTQFIAYRFVIESKRRLNVPNSYIVHTPHSVDACMCLRVRVCVRARAMCVLCNYFAIFARAQTHQIITHFYNYWCRRMKWNEEQVSVCDARRPEKHEMKLQFTRRCAHSMYIGQQRLTFAFGRANVPFIFIRSKF